MYTEIDNDDIKQLEQYDETGYNHGKIGKIETKYIKVLSDTLNNFSNMEYDVNPAKKIMFEYLKEKDFLKNNLDFKDFGFDIRGDTLSFRDRNEKPGDNMYLFNTKTGEVYFINRILFDYINPKYNNYNKIISKGVETAENNLSEIKLCVSRNSI